MENKKEIKRKYDDLIKRINQNKYNKWYCLKDLVTIKNISYKSLKNMVGRVYEMYESQGMIKKEKGRYQIHYSILDAFKLKQPRKNKLPTIYSHNWKSNIVWTTKDYYDRDYHQFLINHFKVLTPDVNYLEAIEYDDNNRLHVHLLADVEPEILKPVVVSLLQTFLDDDRNYRVYCESVANVGCSVDYLLKNQQ
ncbi:hypothetical protein MHM83_07790 [Tenacibaculum sp. Mcav3-52]|uniref:hypothetical protein n=1 Tax=Tenacibaculum sp. Mcav3-52 TaxID=2917762 RepID=UPI001EF1CD26|nr:hypothetical protein [Tenacibaculum sp. Mcav3-52]MCG7501770.1 hypothetical protein [Tenacibaculum sp. Mcav3-52]